MRGSALLFSICLSVSLIAAGAAHAAIVVLGGSAATQCYASAEHGDTDTAFDICSAALSDQSLSPLDRAATFINRGAVRLRARDFEGALADVDQGIAGRPYLSEAYVNRGAALLGLERPKEAVQDFDRAIAMGLDRLYLAYYNRGLAKEQLKDIRGAYADYKKALELDPSFTLAADELTRFKVGNMMPERS